MTLQAIKQSIKQELYQRYCPNLLCQKIWYGEKVKEIHCTERNRTKELTMDHKHIKYCLAGLLALCLGCSPAVKLYPITGEHIIEAHKGQSFTPPRDGYFLSDDYFTKILKARVEEL